jgi:hypothetical protein
MVLLLCILLLLLLGFMISKLRDISYGHEDEAGFHYGDTPTRDSQGRAG